MEETPLQINLREQLGLRVGPEMARYVQRQLAQPANSAVSIIGGDARTGVPQRRDIPLIALRPLITDNPPQ